METGKSIPEPEECRDLVLQDYVTWLEEYIITQNAAHHALKVKMATMISKVNASIEICGLALASIDKASKEFQK